MTIRIWKGRNTDTDTGPEHFDVSFEGRVLRLGEHNHYDDSDFYAIVWDDEKNAPREVEYASTRGWTYYNTAAVDATDEVKAKYAAWDADRRARLAAEKDAREALIPREGRQVRVVKGRKVPVGTEGSVFWYGDDKYARRPRWSFLDDGREGRRIGLRTAGGEKFFTAATNVEVVAA